ncbi:hypothetical protein B5M47_01480 [candidate division CPR3 bacterium 4484_211]|uniref:Glycosyltransferase subfamily 4-like N-terminal domain-containing protein n=1 Tax=candidate division CPR3 bacterium 4484_211 TaxID=1968527 RepID=A0A1W9NYP1_UNCC3|nr:MAG: hypothetical protein B5M47_01480 [candidate division CPR3 bacterium 4484_211]
MKVALVCPYRLSAPGGVQEHIRSLAGQLRGWGHEAIIIAPGRGRTRKTKEELFIGQAVKVPTQNKSWAFASFYFSPNFGSLRNFIEDYRFDLIHFHSPMTPFLSWQILQASNTVNVATFHSEWGVANSLLMNSLDFLVHPLIGKIKEKLSGVIAVSEVAKQSWREIFDGSLPQAVIPNGVNLRRFNTKVPMVRVFGGKPTILFVGRIEARKGLKYLLEAFKKVCLRIEKARLVIVGSGPLALISKLWVKKEGLDGKIFFAGRLPGEILPSYFRGADVFCSPATGGESFGIVLLEAMASGVPVVAFGNPGYREVLKNCPVQGVLVPNKDVDALAESLVKFLGSDELRRKTVKWGLGEVRKYDWPLIARKVFQFYQRVLG